jgi:hypothetical protein
MRPNKIFAGAAAIALILGVLALGWASQLSAYTDPDAAVELLRREPPVGLYRDSAQLDAYTRDWFTKLDALRTEKYPLFGRGAALILLGLCALAAAVAADAKRVQTLASLSSPSNRWLLIGLGVLGTWIVFAGAFVDVFQAIYTHHVPPWADSPGIPIAALVAGSRFWTPVVLIVGLLLMFRARLPVRLLSWDQSRPVLSIVTSVVFLPLLALALAAAALCLVYGDGWLELPGYILWAYVIASTRSAVLSRR